MRCEWGEVALIEYRLDELCVANEREHRLNKKKGEGVHMHRDIHNASDLRSARRT